MHSGVVIVALCLFGAVIASFCNVIIDRLPVELDEARPTGETWGTRPWRDVLGGRSRCSTCGAAVRPHDNLPVVGWLLLRGKCRDCGDRIPVFHPLVEIALPTLWVLMYLRLDGSWLLLPAMWMIPAGIVISVIDLRTLIVPTRVVWPAFFGSVVATVIAVVAGGSIDWIWSAVIGTLTVAGPLFVIWYLLPKALGFGDVRLCVFLGWNVGLAAGVVDGRLLLAVLLGVIMLTVGSVLGIVVGIVMKAGFGRPIPFGPTLFVGAVLCTAFASPLLDPYL